MQITYYAAISLDGFIADVDGGVGWLDKLNVGAAENDCEQFFNTIDGLLMGRKTFDFVYDYGTWPYEDKPTWVCSHRDVPTMKGCNLQLAREPVAAIEEAKSLGLKSLWFVGGGLLAQTLIDAKLLTKLQVSVMPVLLGTGINLVAKLDESVFLNQVKAEAKGGFIQVEYEAVY